MKTKCPIFLLLFSDLIIVFGSSHFLPSICSLNAKTCILERTGQTMSSTRAGGGKARVCTFPGTDGEEKISLKKERERERSEWPCCNSRKEEGSPWWSGYNSCIVLRWLKGTRVDVGQKMANHGVACFWEQTMLPCAKHELHKNTPSTFTRLSLFTANVPSLCVGKYFLSHKEQLHRAPHIGHF